MLNIELTKENDGTVLVARIDLTKNFGPSVSGKSVVVASTQGNVPVDDGKGGLVFVGLNVYKKK